MSHQLPPLNGLRAFEAAARHLSLKNAARELGVTAGAVGQQVKSLESHLNVELFRRLPRGLLLTPEGELFLPDVSHAFRIISNAREKIAPALKGRKLLLGISPEINQLLPKGWLNNDIDLNQSVRYKLSTDDLENIRTGKIDCILRSREAVGHGLSSEKIAEFHSNEITLPIHFVCLIGLAGCHQSRALVDSIQYSMSNQ